MSDNIIACGAKHHNPNYLIHPKFKCCLDTFWGYFVCCKVTMFNVFLSPDHICTTGPSCNISKGPLRWVVNDMILCDTCFL